MSSRKSNKTTRLPFNEDVLVSFLLNEGIDIRGISIPELLAYTDEPTPAQPAKPAPKTKAPAKPKPDEARWYAPGETVTVAGFTLQAGLFYYGKANRHAPMSLEPTLINPGLEVALRVSAAQAITAQSYGYYYYRDMRRQYAQLSKEQRHLYLRWLAGGRCDPLISADDILLFICGLERRALVDSVNDPAARADIPLIIAELERLLSLYRQHFYVQERLSGLLDYLQLDSASFPHQSYKQAPPASYPGQEFFPVALRVVLGQIAKDKAPLPADWAWAWVMADERINKSEFMLRQLAMLQRAFMDLYQREYGAGLRLPNNKTRLSDTYYPLSPIIGSQEKTFALPDMGRVQAPLKKLQAILYLCRSELDAYLRFAGRSPDKIDQLEGWLHLPAKWWPDNARSLLLRIQDTLAPGPRAVTLAELVNELGGNVELTKTTLLRLAAALEQAGIGMEPDMLAGDKTAKMAETVVLFNTESEKPELRQTAAYQAAALTVDLVAFVTRNQPFDHQGTLATWLNPHIMHWNHLTVAHRQRLQARLLRQMAHPGLTLAGAKRSIEALNANVRRPVSQLLAQAVQLQGPASADSVSLLEKLYRSFGIDSQLLYSDLHAGSSQPIALPGSTSSAPAKAAASFSLNNARIAQLQQETEQVSALLAEVFVEDDHIPPVVAASTSAVASTEVELSLWDLDQSHSAFLRQMLQRPSWARSELLALARDFDLLLDGALEQINEAALDQADDTLTDGDDPIVLNPDLIEILLA